MKKIEILADVKARLAAQGFGGLYNPAGPCGCGIDDLAPCGECRVEVEEAETADPEAEEWINGCSAGYKHMDPRPGHVEHGDYVVTAQKEPPEEDEFDSLYD